MSTDPSFDTQSFRDVDQHAECLTGYDQKYQQLSPGRFEGQFCTSMVGRDVGLYFELLNQVLDQSGTVPDDEYSLIFLMNEDEPAKLNGRAFTSADFFFGHPGSTFHTLCRPGTHFGVVSLKKERFEGLRMGDRRRRAARLPYGSHQTDRRCIGQLRAIVKNVDGIFGTKPAFLERPGSIAGYRAAVVDAMSRCVTPSRKGNGNFAI